MSSKRVMLLQLCESWVWQMPAAEKEGSDMELPAALCHVICSVPDQGSLLL